ncbi:hypothetical protein ES332_A03G154500v1 [Gossypium tomentosum]|uniref:Uncharacterized protein n=2 Tax=Gossypium TaxID=3633 RepID=A0ABR0QHY0_GOSAR|nr:hypothetical protein PVK06_007678 [Gossypium arboreum]TYI36621.1 hypothetical protein ES332_A03G154500v1 [Gossypium tomentosum]
MANAFVILIIFKWRNPTVIHSCSPAPHIKEAKRKGRHFSHSQSSGKKWIKEGDDD